MYCIYVIHLILKPFLKHTYDSHLYKIFYPPSLNGSISFIVCLSVSLLDGKGVYFACLLMFLSNGCKNKRLCSLFTAVALKQVLKSNNLQCWGTDTSRYAFTNAYFYCINKKNWHMLTLYMTTDKKNITNCTLLNYFNHYISCRLVWMQLRHKYCVMATIGNSIDTPHSCTYVCSL